jgi:hypothetical protein
MNNKARLFNFIIIILIAYSCSTNKKLAEPKNRILPFSETGTLTEGSIIYGLPKTVFTVEVIMERKIEKPGPYARFAGDMLGLTDIIEKENELWSIVGITVKTHEELDPSEFYIIESNSLFTTNVLALKKEGLILDLNPGIYYSRLNQNEAKDPDINKFSSVDLGSDEYFQTQSDTAYRRVTVDSSFIRIPYIVENKKKLTLEQLAEKAAKRLMEMREGKHLILTGEATVFPQNEAPINEMNRLEKEYAELFTGKTWKETRTFSYDIIPEKEMIGKQEILFQFSELTGPFTGPVKGGKAVIAEFVPEQKTKDLTIISKKQSIPETTAFDKLFYRVPDVVKMKISLGPEILFNSRRLIYQFGEVIQLPANFIIGK